MIKCWGFGASGKVVRCRRLKISETVRNLGRVAELADALDLKSNLLKRR